MWSDRDTEDDCLGFSGYVSVQSEVCVEKRLAPLTLGIFDSRPLPPTTEERWL
jgi:hypothetical protein